jgi:hypothetical protein
LGGEIPKDQRVGWSRMVVGAKNRTRECPKEGGKSDWCVFTDTSARNDGKERREPKSSATKSSPGVLKQLLVRIAGGHGYPNFADREPQKRADL